MSAFIYANPFKFDIDLTVTLFDNWKQTVRRRWRLRNLEGDTEAEQVAHARHILEGMAVELHYLSRYGVDNGVIRVDGKKAAEVVFDGYLPHESANYFVFGVELTFGRLNGFFWTQQKGKQRFQAQRLASEKWDETWQREVLPYGKEKSLRLPCMTNTGAESDFFFRHAGPIKRKRKGKTKRWLAKYDQHDELFRRFSDRFRANGNLSLGDERLWMADDGHIFVQGFVWKPPTFKQTVTPRQSKLASQPRDDTDYVYLIRMGRQLIFKIGKSNDPAGRMMSLQTASPYKLKLEHVFEADNASAAEESLHAFFQNKRLKGEWFRLTEDELQTLQSVSAYREGHFLLGTDGVKLQELFSQ